MEMEIAISLRVSIAEEGANLNEIRGVAQEEVRGELPARVGEMIIEGLQENVRDRLTHTVGRREKKGLGGRVRKGDFWVRCTFRKSAPILGVLGLRDRMEHSIVPPHELQGCGSGPRASKVMWS